MKTCLDDPEYQTWQNNETSCFIPFTFFPAEKSNNTIQR